MYSVIDELLAKVESITNRSTLFITMVDKLLSKIVSGGEAHACYDIHCQWNNVCSQNGTGCDYYQAKVCLTNCGYWYDTGQKCCWTSVPNCSCS